MTAATLASTRFRVIVAFGAVYFIWGATYLATKYAVAAIPSFVMGSVRMLIAGSVLYAIMRLRGAPAPSRREWAASALSGVLMLGLGNGGVIFAARTVNSGLVALIVASVPIWMVFADWLRPNGRRPRASVFLGLALGIIGIAILVGPSLVAGAKDVEVRGTVILLLGSMCWAVGSIITRYRERPAVPLVSVALQMIVAGLWFAMMAVVLGEPSRFDVDKLTTQAIVSWLYLIIGGSLIAYTAYVYLLGKVSPAKAATYAYVNPVIAVVLGWMFAGEVMTPRMIAAAAVILASVATITSAGSSGHTGEHPIAVVSEEAA